MNSLRRTCPIHFLTKSFFCVFLFLGRSPFFSFHFGALGKSSLTRSHLFGQTLDWAMWQRDIDITFPY